MKKLEIIRTIVEAANDNEQLAKSVLGHAIVEASREELNRYINPYEIKPILEAALYLCEQIEKCDYEMKKNPEDRDLIRQCSRFTESLKKCIDKL